MSDEEDLIRNLTAAADTAHEHESTGEDAMYEIVDDKAEDKPADHESVGEVHDPCQSPSPRILIAMQQRFEDILWDYSQMAIGMDRSLGRGHPGSTRVTLAKHGMLAARQTAASIAITELMDMIRKDLSETATAEKTNEPNE